MLVGFKTCLQMKYLVRANRCYKTWRRTLPVGWDFFYGIGENLGVPEGMWNLGFKTQALCRLAGHGGYEWLLLVDDDTFLRTDRLLLPPNGADYAGLVMPAAHGEPWEYCAGGAYWLGPRAWKAIVGARMDSALEDHWVGGVLTRADILPTSMPGYCVWPCECGAKQCLPDPVPEDWVAMMELARWPGSWEKAVASSDHHNPTIQTAISQ